MADRIRKINISTRSEAHILAKDVLPANAVIDAIEVAPNGILYVADYYNNVVYKIFESGTLNGVLVGHIATSGDVDSTGTRNSTGLTARINTPIGITVDTSENIWLADTFNYKIKKLSPSGRCIQIAGDGTTGDIVGNNGLECKFSAVISGLCVDKSGIVYIADSYNHKVKKMWPSGKVVTLAGGPGGAGASGFVNGQGNAARFSYPYDVATDRSGNIYVADYGNNRIRKIDTSGNVTTLAGSSSGFVDGNGLAAKFNHPVRIAMDPSSQFMYVMDYGNLAIRKVMVDGTTTTFMSYNNSLSFYDITVDNSGFLYLSEENA